ncbi:tyrosine-type recombinase/integrase [Corynebacterium ulcerans]|uniref:tyrosine-type recombinase/integrase n=1 Tax=Corynebacterium ulcerans TaxID=65058 RepID=UPI0018D62C45|nr:site-specific integrase [Corynebacterium ulcerans]MBH5297516.1 site-specific integrase [Corynebacterium ulcerans]
MPPKKRRARRRGFGSVRQLPSGRFQARYKGADEKGYTAPTTFPAAEDAEGYLSAIRRKIELGTWEPPEVVEARRIRNATTVSDYFELMLVQAAYPATTEGTYRSIFHNRIKPWLGSAPLVDVDRAMVMDWWVSMRTKTPTTYKRNADSYSLLATIFRRAVDDELLEASPVRIKGADKAPEAEQKPLLTVEQLKGIAAAVPEHYRVAVQVAGGCALRIGEWSELRRKDVVLDVDNGEAVGARFSVSRAVKETATGKKYAGETKTGKQRWVTIPAHLIPLLVEHMDTMKDTSRDALLFPNADGGWTDRRRFNRMLKRAGETVDRADVSSHDLRHFGGTEFARAGATMPEVMARLGHSTTTSALRYQHATRERDAELANRMAAPVVDDEAIKQAAGRKAELRAKRAAERKAKGVPQRAISNEQVNN